MSDGWIIKHQSDVVHDEGLGPKYKVYVWFTSPSGEHASYGAPAENVPMAWLCLDRYLKRAKA